MIRASKPSIYAEFNEKILASHADGLTNRGISDSFGIPHWYVGKLIRSSGLQPNGRRRGVRLVEGEDSRCSTCLEWKPTAQFPVMRRGKHDEYLLTYCRQCRKREMDTNLNSDHRKFLSSRYQRIKDRAIKSGLDFDLTKEYMVALYEEQQGLCFYTDAPMVLRAGNGRSRDGLSLDRIDPAKGYTKENVVYCTVRVNTSKSDFSLEELEKWMPEWHRRISVRLAPVDNVV